ncbi:ankyrin repeat domain-containing protein [Streptomyces mayteni]
MESGFSPAHQAVAVEDLETLGRLLGAGADIHEEHHGLTLLHHAVDVEIDGYDQTGEPLTVDTTAFLLARGADPTRPSGGGTGVSAEHMAFVRGHWLALELFEEWKRERKV